MYTLIDVFMESKQNPSAFLGKPTKMELEGLKVGNLVLIGIKESVSGKTLVERKFVRINKIKVDKKYEGFLDRNQFPANPYVNSNRIRTLKEGDRLAFEDKHVWGIWRIAK